MEIYNTGKGVEKKKENTNFLCKLIRGGGRGGRGRREMTQLTLMVIRPEIT